MLILTPEQQAKLDHVVGVVAQNSVLRQWFKTSMNELHKQPNWDDPDYMADSDDSPAVNSRAVLDAVKLEIKKVDSNLITVDPWLFDKVCDAICSDFFER